MSYITIDVDIDDVINSMGRWERRELLQNLQEDGYIPKECTIDNDGTVKLPSFMQKNIDESNNNDFNLSLQKLYNIGWKLTTEEEQYIINIAKRF